MTALVVLVSPDSAILGWDFTCSDINFLNQLPKTCTSPEMWKSKCKISFQKKDRFHINCKITQMWHRSISISKRLTKVSKYQRYHPHSPLVVWSLVPKIGPCACAGLSEAGFQLATPVIATQMILSIFVLIGFVLCI